jgi:Kef-type K+ transport system membrane component KefB
VAQNGWGPAAIRQLLALGAMFAFSLVLVFLMRELVWWFPERFGRLVRTQDAGEIGLRVVLVLLFGFVVVARNLLGLSLILAAVLGGLAFGFVFRDRGVLATKMGSFGYGFFIPIFFVSVGLTVKLSDVLRPENLAILGTLTVISAAGRVAIPPLLRLAGLPWRQAVAIGLFLSAPLSLVVAVAAAGKEVGAIDDPTYASAILFSVLCAIICPSIARVILSEPKRSPSTAQAPAVSGPALRPAA